MDGLLDQLGLDQTFFIELALIAGLFVVLSKLFFAPYLQLFQARHKKTVLDQEAAEELVKAAQLKLDQYKALVQQEKLAIKAEYDAVLLEARKEESKLLSEARDEARAITQAAVESVTKQKEKLRRDLEFDVESIAQNISDRLLSKKV